MNIESKPCLATSFLSGLLLVGSLALAEANGPELVHTNQHLLSADAPVNLTGDDWEIIQKQIHLGQYKANTDGNGGFLSSNPEHGWHIHYAADGTTTLTPQNNSAKPYHLGLKLQAFGYAELQSVGRPQRVSQQDFSVTYQWNDNLREQWINSGQQLEQWFIVEHKPEGAGKEQPLTVQMTLHSELNARQAGNTLYFTDPAGTNITYNKLKVWDADGRELPATMQLATNSLSLLVDDSAARYPLTIDPSFEQHSISKASNAGAGDQFGYSVAISGNTLVVGARQERSSSTVVNGNESDDSADGAGAAYVFVQSGTGWTQQAYLKASNAEADDNFGHAVAISGDTIVVGAYREDSNSTTINRDQADNTAIDSGAAYVFTRTGGDWVQQAYLKPTSNGTNDRFGQSVAISGNTVVVGAVFEDGSAPGINGGPIDNSASNSGAAYVFERDGSSSWTQQAYVKASNPGAQDQFGHAVALSGNTFVVGARHEGSNATGINGDQSDNSAARAGAAYVFVRAGTLWTQQAYVKASASGGVSPASYFFGYSVAISDDTLVVGAAGEDSNSSGVNGDENNRLAIDSGAAYVYTRSASTWTQQAYLKASNTNTSDGFGASVAASGDSLIVGADGEDSSSVGVNGSQHNNLASSSGAAYVFTRTGSNWSQQAYLKASNAGANDQFGQSVALSGDNSIVGAHQEDSDNSGMSTIEDSGAAYVFSVVPSHVLPNNTWQQVSLPLQPPAGSNTVADVLASAALGNLGTDWRMYRYDTVIDNYVELTNADILQQGVGYWIIQYSGSNKTLDMPAGSLSSPVSLVTGCPPGKNCFNMPVLGTEAAANQWNMIGYPYAIGQLLSNSRITATTSNCLSGCTLDTALTDNLVHNELWNYEAPVYAKAGTASGTLNPWLGYWSATLPNADGSNPTLMIPKP